MSKLYSCWNYFRRHKYFFVLLLFVVWMGFLDENCLMNRYAHKRELADLRREIRRYTENYEHDTRYLNEMDTNPEVLIEIARERYYMKTQDEDVFVFDKNPEDEDAE